MARIRRRANGNYEAVYYDRTGQRRFRSTRTRNARTARAVADRYEADANDSDPASRYKASVGDALGLLLEDRQAQVAAGNRSAGTVRMYRVKAGHLIRVFEMEGDQQKPFLLVRLKARHVDEYIEKRRDEGAAEHTIAKELTTLRAALRICKRREMWPGAIEAVMPAGFSPGYKPRGRYLTVQELHALVTHLTPDHAARACFAVATSANMGETERAMREDITADAVYVRGTKTDSRPRHVPIVMPWQRSLLEITNAYAQGADGRLFAMSAGGFHTALVRAAADAKIPRVTSNDLRRTFGHWMRAAQVPLELIAPAMGHATTQMLQKVYGRLDAGELATLMGRAAQSATLMPQTLHHGMENVDQADAKKTDNPVKSHAGGGGRTHTGITPEDFESIDQMGLQPRDYERKRKQTAENATLMPQRLHSSRGK